jgi:8-oxo-dGTP diphosphatase
MLNAEKPAEKSFRDGDRQIVEVPCGFPAARDESPVRVACAIIQRCGTVLAAQRAELMNMPLKWEFPGGKLEKGEKPAECLVREIREELGVEVRILHALPAIIHPYDTWTIELLPFVCEIAAGSITLHEHKAITWKSPQDLLDLDWPEADIPVLAEYLRYLETAAARP